MLFFTATSTRARAELLEFPEKAADARLAEMRQAIEGLHRKAMASTKPWTEESLRKTLPAKFLKLDAQYARLKDPKVKAQALAQLALLYADLAWKDKIAPIAPELRKVDPELADRLGNFEESEHFFARVVGVDVKWAQAAVKLGEAARTGYLKLFGFREVSKVPGKKIRILIHLDPSQKGPRLYFHPTPLYHGEIRFEIPEEKYLTLAGGCRIDYGFCHELGHMIAMWGEYPRIEDDKHAWAHYAGSLVLEEVYEQLGNSPWPGWTAFQRRASGRERLLGEIKGKTAGLGSYESILALFHTVGEEFGTQIYGRAWLWLEKNKRFRKINNVPYLWMKDLEDALTAVVPKGKAPRIKELFKKS